MKLPITLDASAHAARESAACVQEQADGSAWAQADQRERAIRREAGKRLLSAIMEPSRPAEFCIKVLHLPSGCPCQQGVKLV